MNAKPISPKHFIFYFLFALIHLGAILSGNEDHLLAMISKSLLLPSLMIVFYRLTRNRENRQRKFVFAALILSWFGDVILMFQQQNANFFLIGLVCFLLAHVSYIYSFHLAKRSGVSSLLRKKPWLVLLFVIYANIIFYVIHGGLDDMLVPVMVYMCVILAMGLTALNRFGKVSRQSLMDVFLGAVFFMLSDSLLAINKFHSPFAFASLLIMLTYIAAQYFIVKGMIEETIEASI